MRLFSSGSISIAAVFDGARHGLFRTSDPLSLNADFDAVIIAKFGLRPDVLLCAATHKPITAWAAGVLIVNPGSPTLADSPNVTLLDIDGAFVSVRHLPVRQ